MKISDSQIISSARRQRDAAASSVNPRPWAAQRRLRVPLWLAAVPAAAVAGFVVGTAVRPAPTLAPALTARADTVYVERQVTVPQTPDTVVRYVYRTASAAKATTPKTTTGKSIDQDNIDYSMLVLR